MGELTRLPRSRGERPTGGAFAQFPAPFPVSVVVPRSLPRRTAERLSEYDPSGGSDRVRSPTSCPRRFRPAAALRMGTPPWIGQLLVKQNL